MRLLLPALPGLAALAAGATKPAMSVAPLALTDSIASDNSCSALKPCVAGACCSDDGTFPTSPR
jgi:hypothetical protein